ncbi:MAG: hypothetical protein ACLFRV_02195 [Acidimicrobiales bacterium]
MGDILGVVLLLGIPFAIFVFVSWKQQERDRDNGSDHPRGGSHDSHWGGMGRPGN